ncbi:DUF397 domain-containing protein [Nocardia transvalensis]|uniref:DUF397 domain-containing protein n=1 Tax=Nocardia transvalensis TaxID=37333 RepID=UPI0018939630|nr:DUF397 domain-containing protein [Nocardia transvalensis]MBF6333346.1 DUF397 domain-containing protein [Nocardia transvalensis]
MTTNIHPDGWTKSTFSGNNGGACVEVKFAGVMVSMRDSKYLRNPANDPDAQPIIEVPADCWNRILDLSLSKTSGEIILNEAASGQPKDVLTVELQADGGAQVGSSGQGVALIFTPDEWDAFAKGVADGQFDIR